MYERYSRKVLPIRQFAWRLTRHLAIVAVVVLISLVGGMAGYRYLAPMPWVDAFMNAAMIMGGMGPVGDLSNSPAKIFAGCYALYAGLVFIVALGTMIAPLIHRILHRLHADDVDSRGRKS